MAATTRSSILPTKTSTVILFSYREASQNVVPEKKHLKQFDLSKPQLTVSVPKDTDNSTTNSQPSWFSPKLGLFSVLFMTLMTLGVPSFLWGYSSTPTSTIVQPVQAAEPEETNPFANMVTITVEPTSIPVPTPQQATPLTLEEQARSIAREFNINEEVFVCTLRKESGLRSTWPNGTLKCGDGGRSCGIAQIQLGTWKSIRKHAGWSQDDLRANDVESMRTAAYGISTLWPYHWTGYKLCTG